MKKNLLITVFFWMFSFVAIFLTWALIVYIKCIFTSGCYEQITLYQMLSTVDSRAIAIRVSFLTVVVVFAWFKKR